ncbi:MAG: amino acid synthesis family protein [Pseudomonadota bacterium]
MALLLRKIVRYEEDIFIEGGKAAPATWRLFAAAAVLTNPWADRGYVEDLKPEIQAQAPILGEKLTSEILSMAARDGGDGGELVEAYGKAAVVGTEGEIEHGSGLIHTLRFGNFYRDAVQAKSYLSFSNTRAGPNGAIAIPLMHKHDAGMRSHYLTIQFAISDSPAPNEIVVALGAGIGGRPHHRIGDRYQDLKELGHDLENPAGV